MRPLPDSAVAPKDANEALQQGADIPEMIRRAISVPDERILHFSQLRDQVLVFADPAAPLEGTAVSSLPHFTRITKGLRCGELVVLTGPTGSGKTTFLSQLSLDFAKSGKSCLWGSFEIKNVQLLRKMFMQFCKMSDLSVLKRERIEVLANDFEQLPLYFLNYFGGTDIDEVIEAMDFAVYKYDVEHILIDNLQFMMPRGSVRRRLNFDKFDSQDAVIDRFRKFATEKQVNVILVIHPRKEEETTRLSLASVFGTGKATQEADMVMILQRLNGGTAIEVKKNRYDGELGSVPLEFSRATQSYFELNGGPIDEIKSATTKGMRSKTKAETTELSSGTKGSARPRTSKTATVVESPEASVDENKDATAHDVRSTLETEAPELSDEIKPPKRLRTSKTATEDESPEAILDENEDAAANDLRSNPEPEVTEPSKRTKGPGKPRQTRKIGTSRKTMEKAEIVESSKDSIDAKRSALISEVRSTQKAKAAKLSKGTRKVGRPRKTPSDDTGESQVDSNSQDIPLS